MTGGILGLLGVIITLIYSTNLNKKNREFQEKTNAVNQRFQEELEEKNQEFQIELDRKDKEHKLWMNKYNILIQLISYRYMLESNEYKAAMNAIPAVFQDSHKVMQAYRSFYDYSELPPANKNELIANEKMVKIYMKMFEHLGIEENVDEVILHRIFNAS